MENQRYIGATGHQERNNGVVLLLVGRVVHQEPPADARKLPAPPTCVGVTPAQQITERRDDNETRVR